MIDISVSFIKSIYKEEKTISLINDSIANYLHIDIMDGIFVKEYNYDFTTIAYYLNGVKKPLDIHLMVKDVKKYIDEYKILKPTYITFHLEAVDNPKEVIDYIKENNIGVGLAFNPSTDIEKIIPYLSDIDIVLVLSVNPGAGGQKFIKDTIPKIKKLRNLQKNYHYLISVDGGINDETIKFVYNDIDIAVSGSYICESSDFNKQIVRLKKQ